MWQCRSPLRSALRDQVREGVRCCRFELTAVLAQLGLDVVQAEQRVHLGLGGAPMGLAGGVVEQAVLGHVQALAHGGVAQRHVVLLGAGQVLEQVAELVGGDDSQVDPDAGVGAQADAGLGGRGGWFCEIERGGALASASGSVAVAITSRSLTVSVMRRAEPASSTWVEAGCSLSAVISGSAMASALSSTTRVGRSPAPANRRLARMASSALGPKPLSFWICCPSAAVRNPSSESIPSSSNSRRARFGPEAGQAGHLDHAGRELGPQLGRGGDVAGVGQVDDLLLDDRPDAGQLGGASLPREAEHRHRRLAHRLGGVAVGHHAVDRAAVELGKVAQFVEGGRDLGVRRVRHLQWS